MNKKKHFVEETSISKISVETGEMIEETRTRTHVISREQEPFFCTYTRVLGMLYNVKTVTATKLFWKFCELSDFNTGKVRITTSDRYRICEELHFTGNTYYNSVKELEICSIITKSGRGEYLINPELAWKGDAKTREMLLNSGCSITIKPSNPLL